MERPDEDGNLSRCIDLRSVRLSIDVYVFTFHDKDPDRRFLRMVRWYDKGTTDRSDSPIFPRAVLVTQKPSVPPYLVTHLSYTQGFTVSSLRGEGRKIILT